MNPAPPHKPLKKWFEPLIRASFGPAHSYGVVALKVILSAGLLLYLAHRTHVDFSELLRGDPRYLLAALAVLIVQHILGGLRWHVVLRCFGVLLAPWRVIAIHFISCFFNLVLPASAGGDMVRVFYARRKNISMDNALRSVIADRLVALTALFIMILLGQPFAARLIGDRTALDTLRFIAIAAFAGIIILLVGARMLRRWAHYRLVGLLCWPSQLARQVLLTLSIAWRTIALSLVIHSITCLSAGLIASAYGVNLPINALFILMPPVILALGMPISLGGWGVREAAMVAALSGVGVAPDTSFLIALTLGVISGASTLPGLIGWIFYRHTKTSTAT